MSIPNETIVECACRFFRTREEIVAQGYVPGWHGEPVEVGDRAVIYGRGQWREVIVTKVTPSYVEGVYTTPGAVQENDRIRDLYLNPERARSAVAAEASQSSKNWDWHAQVAAAEPGDPWPGTRWTFRAEQVTESRAFIAAHPDRAEYIAACVAKRLSDVEEDRVRATLDRWAYLVTTKARGSRTGKDASNLYV